MESAASATLSTETDPPTGGPFEQLALALIGAVGDGKPPEKGLWREVLRLTGMRGVRHHVGWLLYGRSNRKGRVPPISYAEIAEDGGISVRSVIRSIEDGERAGAWKRKRRRSKRAGHVANGYELNLGGRFKEAPPCVSETQGLMSQGHKTRAVRKGVRTGREEDSTAGSSPTMAYSSTREGGPALPPAGEFDLPAGIGLGR